MKKLFLLDIPVEEPVTSSPVLIYISIAALVLLIVLFIIFRKRKKRTA